MQSQVASMAQHIKDVTPAALDARIASAGSKLLVAYLWGPDCPNCIIFKRSLPKLLEQLTDVEAEVLEVDVYAHPEVATRYGVHGIPHFLLFKAGQKLGKMSEFRGEKYWLDVIRERA
jgi:thioredoxin 1